MSTNTLGINEFTIFQRNHCQSYICLTIITSPTIKDNNPKPQKLVVSPFCPVPASKTSNNGAAFGTPTSGHALVIVTTTKFSTPSKQMPSLQSTRKRPLDSDTTAGSKKLKIKTRTQIMRTDFSLVDNRSSSCNAYYVLSFGFYP